MLVIRVMMGRKESTTVSGQSTFLPSVWPRTHVPSAFAPALWPDVSIVLLREGRIEEACDPPGVPQQECDRSSVQTVSQRPGGQ